MSRYSWLVHAFSMRPGGVSEPPTKGLNLGFVEWDRRANVQENRKRFFSQVGTDGFSMASLRQIHSAAAFLARHGASGEPTYTPSGCPLPQAPGGFPPPGDILLADQVGVLLSIRTADCMPILISDTRRRAVAAVHAGWRGALECIIEKAVGDMRLLFGSQPTDLVAAIGPSIRACCYEVGQETVDAFCGRFAAGEQFFRRRANPRATRGAVAPSIHLDLLAVARHQFRSAGVPPFNIHVADFCTACRTDLFFSHRKENGQTGRMMAVIGIRPRLSGL